MICRQRRLTGRAFTPDLPNLFQVIPFPGPLFFIKNSQGLSFLHPALFLD